MDRDWKIFESDFHTYNLICMETRTRISLLRSYTVLCRTTLKRESSTFTCKRIHRHTKKMFFPSTKRVKTCTQWLNILNVKKKRKNEGKKTCRWETWQNDKHFYEVIRPWKDKAGVRTKRERKREIWKLNMRVKERKRERAREKEIDRKREWERERVSERERRDKKEPSQSNRQR